MNTERIISLDGGFWRIVGEGVEQAGQRFCHLQSTTRLIKGRPQQICTFVPLDVIAAAELVPDTWTRPQKPAHRVNIEAEAAGEIGLAHILGVIEDAGR
jgi:hypothetical protein